MTTLQPIVRQRLLQFRRRRNLLLSVKGLSAAVLLAIFIGLLFAFVDSRSALSNNARWIIATAIYLAIAFIVGIVAVRPWLRGRSLAWLASMFELAEPKMKDRLLSAIELSNDFYDSSSSRANGATRPSALGSADFRTAVQRSAARRIESIDVATVLPWRLVRMWMCIGAIVLGSVVVMCFVPNLHLANRLGRILFPMANIGRISKYAIELEQPSHSNPYFPEETPVSFQAVIRGGIPSNVILETESDDSIRQTLDMHRDTSATNGVTFQTHWTPPLGQLRYRVVAEDSSTAWYQIEIKPSPKVETFSIEYRYPDYARQPNVTLESDQGNLEALSGTVASISIFTNQKIAQGEVRIQIKDRSLQADETDSIIPMKRSSSGSLSADIPMNHESTYRINLIAAETHFVNTFSPRYLIHVIPDKPPTVRWVNPTESSLAVLPNQLLDLAIVIDDELPVASVTQQIKSGANDWNDISVPIDELANIEISLQMDFETLKVQPGTAVQTRWVVTDRKGQVTNSSILDLFISSMSFDPDRQKNMRQRVEMEKQVSAYHAKLEEHAKLIQSEHSEWKKDRENKTLRNQLASSVQQFADMALRESTHLRQTFVATLPKLDDSVSAAEFELLAQAISKIENETLPLLNQAAKQANSLTNNVEAIESASRQIDKLVKNTSQVSRRARDFVSHDVLSQVGQDLSVLLRYQKELKSSVNRILPEQYRRRQVLVARQMQDLSELIREQLPVLRNRSERTANQWSDWLDSQARTILDITGKENKPRPPQEKLSDRERLAEQIERELQQHQNANNIDGNLAHELLQSRKELQTQVGTASHTIEKLRQAVSQSNQPGKHDEMEYSIVQEHIPALEQLASRRELQQARHDGDNQFVSDLGEAYRATKAALKDRRNDPKATGNQLQSLQNALKTLEAIHDLDEASKTLKQLHSTERWKSNSLEAHFEQPRVWDAFQQQLSQSIQSLSAAKVPSSTIQALQSIAQNEAKQRIDSKIGPRRWTTLNTASAAQDIESLQSELQEQLDSLSSLARSARETLAEKTPSISTLALDAAEKLRESSEETKKLSQQVAEDKVPEPAPRIEQLQQSVEKSVPALQQLREALADKASRQDLMKQSEAAIARDADASISITNDIQKRVQQSLEDIPALKDDAAVILKLGQSISTQNQSADTLEQIAKHFEKLGNSDEPTSTANPVSETPVSNELTEAAKNIARQPELDKAHADAEKLRRLASLDPKRVLEQLEKELVRNKPMRSELSDISKEAVTDAIKTLDFTAQRENELGVGLENSDFEFLMQKEKLQADINRAAKTASYIADSLATRIQSTADQAQFKEGRKETQRLKDDLHRAIQTTSRIDSRTSITELIKSAKDMATGLEYFRRGVARQAVDLALASETPLAADNNQLQNRQREAEELQMKFREEDVRQAFTRERNRQQEAKQAKQELQKLDRDVGQRKRELDAAELRQEAAKTFREQLQMAELKPLKASNPSAQLSSRTATAAVMAAQAAAEELQKSLDSSQWSEVPRAAQRALKDASVDQEGLINDVANAAASLARAARHEQRLANMENSEALDEQGSQIAAIADGKMQLAQEVVQKAAEEAALQSSENPSQANSESTLQSQQALQAAEQALRDQAAALRNSTDQAPSSKDPSDLTNSTSQKAQPKSDGLLSPQEMARMLDELDKQLNEPPKESEGQGQGTQKPSNSADPKGKPSKSSASDEPSESAADERAQSLADAAQRLSAEMNQQRQAMESTPKTMPETGAPDSQSRSETQAGKTSSGMVMPVEIESLEDWGKLRNQSSENAIEGDREQLMPAYRKQIEEYFRILSKRQLSK